jgi:hypothetical protein
MMHRIYRGARRPLRVGLALALLATAACRDITALKQENKSQLSAKLLYTPANAQLIVNGAIGDFECAFNRYVVGSGLLGDELVAAISRIDNYEYDRRTLAPNHPYGTGTCNSSQIPGVYTPLSVARAAADTAVAKLEEWTDEQVANRAKLIGQASAYAGYSLVLLGEGMCSAAINVGPELTPAQLFAEARTRFDKAISSATTANDATTLNLARVGRARALQGLGDLAAAATDAALVPEGFVVNFNANATDPRRQNQVFVHTRQSLYSSVAPAYRNVTFDSAGVAVADPRVAVVNTGQVGTAGTHAQVWEARKYATNTAPMAVAKWAEARLILAESKLANDLQGAVDIINDLHAKAGITPYDATGATPEQVRAQLLEERRRTLFLEGHRLGDIRRYNLPLDPAPGSPYVNGGTYGDLRCFPLPDVERINNPNIGSK